MQPTPFDAASALQDQKNERSHRSKLFKLLKSNALNNGAATLLHGLQVGHKRRADAHAPCMSLSCTLKFSRCPHITPLSKETLKKGMLTIWTPYLVPSAQASWPALGSSRTAEFGDKGYPNQCIGSPPHNCKQWIAKLDEGCDDA
jgi:hypothetical protein